MDSAFGVVICLALVFGLVTVVGHGIWMLLAAMFGGSQPQAARPVSSGYCPRCGARLKGSGCYLCHWPAPFVQLDRTAEALSATRDQIERLSRLGLINKSAGERLLATLDDEGRRLRYPATVPETAVA